jgi:hypothetical protein
LQEKYKEEVVKKHGEGFNYEEEPIDSHAVYDSGGRKAHGRQDWCIVLLTLWTWDMVPLITVDCFLWRFAQFDGVLDSRKAMPLWQSSSSMSSGLMPHASQIHLNNEMMKNQLRTTQDMLVVKQENHRETWEWVNAFNTQIQAFLMVRNKNKFISFLTLSDIYVC